jgi:hypothetical protein
MVDLVLLASSQLWNHLITVGSNTKLNPLSHNHRNSPKCWEFFKKKGKINPLLELVLEASSQLRYPLVTKGFNTEHIPLSRTHRNSPECWENEK